MDKADDNVSVAEDSEMSDGMPMFSVVIPLYNKADTIERTLNSVRMQTIKDYEVVVVDDGSQDKGPDLVERFYGIKNLKLVRQSNAGVSAARNRGAAESNGRFIASLDADDEWMPTFLEEIKTVIDANPDARILGSGYELHLNNYVYRCRPRKKTYICNLYDVWPYFQPINSSCFVVEREAYINSGGYRPGLTFWEDGEFWFRLARQYLFYIVRKPLSVYHDDAQQKATFHLGNQERKMPHMELLEKWISEGLATDAMKHCLKTETRKSQGTLITDPFFWIYKRIRFYLWFSRKSYR